MEGTPDNDRYGKINGWNTPSSTVAFYTCEEGSFLKLPSKSQKLPIYSQWPQGYLSQGPIFEDQGCMPIMDSSPHSTWLLFWLNVQIKCEELSDWEKSDFF